jgi:aminoglycoside/choline kinase family phosphotransferase
LHATWWEKPGLDEMPAWLPQWDMRHFTMFQDVYQNGWPSFVDKMGARLTFEMARIGEKLGCHVASVMDYNHQSPRTLTHFDYQLDNIFFPQPEVTDTLIVVDWQVVTIGHGVMDVSNLISGNIESRTRATVEMDLIKMYHQCLVENGVQAYTFSHCLEDYKISLLDHLARHIIVTFLMDLTPDMEHRFLDIVIPRYFDSIFDMNADELLPL